MVHGVERVKAEAVQRGAHPHVVDGSTVSTKDGAMTAIADALSFPDYFGRNLDALYDCLRDLSWLPAGEHVLILSSPQVLRSADPRAYDGIERALSDAAAASAEPRLLRVVLVEP
ncbi:MAG: barstar family protein [Sciscionella sp.]